MDRPGPPDAATLARRLRRERAARREAEVVAEQVTRELYETVQQLAAFKAVLDATTDFVAIADLAGRPSYLNRALCAFLGVQGGDVDGGNVVDLLTARSRARYLEEAVPALHQVGRWRGEFAWARPGGGEAVVSQVLIAHRSPDGQIDRVSSISRDVTEQQALQEQLAHQALHDPLTGLANRRLFFDRLDLARARARRSGSVLGVLFMDLDGFKAINDTAMEGSRLSCNPLPAFQAGQAGRALIILLAPARTGLAFMPDDEHAPHSRLQVRVLPGPAGSRAWS